MAVNGNKTCALWVAGIIFLIVAIMHLLRLILKVEITISGHALPMSASYWGIGIALLLSIWMFKAARNKIAN
jgi:uncharacterized membrane protein YecN with MAPEG domain